MMNYELFCNVVLEIEFRVEHFVLQSYKFS